jgi:hypothetical protein
MKMQAKSFSKTSVFSYNIILRHSNTIVYTNSWLNVFVSMPRMSKTGAEVSFCPLLTSAPDGVEAMSP